MTSLCCRLPPVMPLLIEYPPLARRRLLTAMHYRGIILLRSNLIAEPNGISAKSNFLMGRHFINSLKGFSFYVF